MGPEFPNTNSISQGCPLAILRINGLIAAWVRVIQSHNQLPLCSVGGCVDDRNLRSTDLSQLRKSIEVTAAFDNATDAVVNAKKTVLFATSTTARQKMSNITLNNRCLDTVRLLGGHLTFTKRRARWLANDRAKNVHTCRATYCHMPAELPCA